jgi:superfamily I DNA and RNA helicase
MSVACQNLAQNLDMDQKQAVHRVSLGNNVLVCGLPGSRKTHVMFFTHVERLAQSKGETSAVIALGATKDVANALS